MHKHTKNIDSNCWLRWRTCRQHLLQPARKLHNIIYRSIYVRIASGQWRICFECTDAQRCAANINTRCTSPSHVRHFFFKYGRCDAVAATVSLTNRADRAHECAAGPPSTTRHRDRSQSARACEKPKPAKCWPKSKSSQTVRVGVYSTTWVYNHTQQQTDDSHKYYRSTNTFITIPGAFATNRNRRCTTTTAATTTTTTNVCIAINNLFYCLELANSKCIPT